MQRSGLLGCHPANGFMTRRWLAILLLIVLASSCRKDHFTKDLRGTWELASAYTFGGPVPYPPGNGNLLILRKDKTFEQQQPGQATQQGYYTLESKEDCSPRTDKKMLVLHFSTYEQEAYVEVKDNTLFLSTSNCIADGGTSTYRRLD